MGGRQEDQDVNEVAHLVVQKARVYKKIKSVEISFPKSNGFILHMYRVWRKGKKEERERERERGGGKEVIAKGGGKEGRKQAKTCGKKIVDDL